ncbi:stabilizer of axonemal microtubules 2 isoform X1 [Micropterus dolomieu]|uniref:stabilizer of axonemal microtubules 2 isoform X1 n=1 Tax=Micropterus dolomieu TaxID=147949 RepID=UPI001E8D26A3|nr:stabilizer of axonemal microtubules 2 isoform X1 [Micropterus dolomieu]
MPPKTDELKCRYHAPRTRKLPDSHKAQPRAMTTEYQERFLPPRCYTAIISTSMQRDPYHSLKGMSADMSTYTRSYYVDKWMKTPPKASQPPKDNQKCTSAPHNPVRARANQMESKEEDYISVYKHDFRTWKVNMRRPYKLHDGLKVNQGLIVTNSEGCFQKKSVQVEVNSKPVPQEREPQHFESITSYRSDYVTHPLQPRTGREKPVYQTNKRLPLEHGTPSGPNMAWDINHKVFDKASEFFEQFKTRSLETNFHGEGKAKESSPQAEHSEFLSTTHADYKAHKCQRTKPVLPPMHTIKKSMKPFQGTTTMKEDYKAWDTPQRTPIVHKEELDWPMKTSFSVCIPKPAEHCKTNPKPFNYSCNATQKPQRPVENGTFSSFTCISTGTEESRRYWTTSLDRGVTWPDGDARKEPSESHQIISSMVSSRN